MKDYEVVFNVLKNYMDFLESQAKVIRVIRENEGVLEEILGGSPDIQRCANEIESHIDPRSSYLFGYVEKLLKLEDLNKSQVKTLKGFREKIFEYASEFENPLVKVNYE